MDPSERFSPFSGAGTAVVHIGHQKSGSKAIQTLLHLYRARLAEAGFHLPAATSVNHYDLALAAFAGHSGFNAVYCRAHGLSGDGHGEAAARIRADLERERAATAAANWIFSFEGLFPLDRDEVARIVDLLRSLFGRVVVFAVVRRQDRWAVSGYSTRLRNNNLAERLILKTELGRWLGHRYGKELDRWAAEVGRDHVHVVGHEDSDDIAGTFAGFLGLAGELVLPGRQNATLSAYGQEVLRKFNAIHAGRWADKERRLRRVLYDMLPTGDPSLPARDEVAEQLAFFADDNEQLAARYLPPGSAFFSDMGDYPERPIFATVPDDEVRAWIARAEGQAAQSAGAR